VLHEVDNPEPHDDLTLNAVANSAGKIFNNQFAPEQHDIGVRFYLTASGVQSQARTTFTDSVPRVTAVSTDIFSPNQASSSGVLDNVDITARNVNSGDLTGFDIRIRCGTSLVGTLVRTFVIGNLAANTDVIRNWDGKNNDSTVFVVTVKDKDNDSDDASKGITVHNVAPTLSNVGVTSPINENGTATLTGNITDPGTLDTFSLVINWGDGSGPETLNLAAGTSSFSLSHTYLDDSPTGTAWDVYTIGLTTPVTMQGQPASL
jgi:hypothetical protein